MRKRSRRSQPFTLLRKLGRPLGQLRAHPFRAALIGAISLMLVWIVLVQSLPFALAPDSPGLALALNPANPAALVGRAGQVRERLLAQVSPSPQASEASAGMAKAVNITPLRSHEAVRATLEEPRREPTSLQAEIRGLAARAIAVDPLNAGAYRLLAEIERDPDRARLLMQQAVKRSRRESVAVFWLLNDSFHHQDYEAALVQAGILLATRPELADFVLAYVLRIAEAPEGLPLVVAALEKKPDWRRQFFNVLPRSVQRSDAAFSLISSLREKGSAPSAQELAPYLDALIGNNRVDAAYNAWLQSLPGSDLSKLGLITNGSFETPPSGLPFDWRLAPGLNATAEIVPPAGAGGEYLLHVSFGSGRVRFPEVSQVLYLPAGLYRLQGKLRGRIVSKRGLRWQAICRPYAAPAGPDRYAHGRNPRLASFRSRSASASRRRVRGPDPAALSRCPFCLRGTHFR